MGMTIRRVAETNHSDIVTSFSMMLAANSDPIATTKTKSNTFIFDSVRFPEMRSMMIMAKNPITVSAAVRATMYQL